MCGRCWLAGPVLAGKASWKSEHPIRCHKAACSFARNHTAFERTFESCMLASGWGRTWLRKFWEDERSALRLATWSKVVGTFPGGASLSYLQG